MAKRRLKNNFKKWLAKCKEMKRQDHIAKKAAWFTNTRSATSLKDCYMSWILFVKKIKMAKKFIARSGNSIDKRMANEAFSKWKQFCSKKRQKVYLDNIEELSKRKEDHETQIKTFKKEIEKNESR